MLGQLRVFVLAQDSGGAYKAEPGPYVVLRPDVCPTPRQAASRWHSLQEYMAGIAGRAAAHRECA